LLKLLGELTSSTQGPAKPAVEETNMAKAYVFAGRAIWMERPLVLPPLPLLPVCASEVPLKMSASAVVPLKPVNTVPVPASV